MRQVCFWLGRWGRGWSRLTWQSPKTSLSWYFTKTFFMVFHQKFLHGISPKISSWYFTNQSSMVFRQSVLHGISSVVVFEWMKNFAGDWIWRCCKLKSSLHLHKSLNFEEKTIDQGESTFFPWNDNDQMTNRGRVELNLGCKTVKKCHISYIPIIYHNHIYCNIALLYSLKGHITDRS